MKPTVLSRLGQRTQAPPISWLMKLTLDHPHLISLAAGFTDNETLPVIEARELLNELLDPGRSGREALQYGATAGDHELRRLTARRLRQMDREAVRATVLRRKLHIPEEVYSTERLLVTSGSQQLLYMITEALCDPGDLVLVEDPTYFVYLSILQSHGLECRGIRLEADGIDLDHLEQVLALLRRTGALPRLKLLYLVSYFQNPSGVTTAFEKKTAVLKLLRRYERAAGHPIHLLEDAAYRELRFGGDDVPSGLCAPGGADRVIYSGTYSKPFATGVRVGFGILPEPLLRVVSRIKGNHDFGTANLSQQLLRRALTSGRYERHVARLRKRYAQKAEAMTAAARAHFPPTVEWQTPRGGLYLWASVPAPVRSGVKSRLFETALRHDVLYVPGALCYAPDPTRVTPDRSMRLSFGGATEPDIRTGMKRLGATLHELMDR